MPTQPYRLQYPLNPPQVEQLDEMLQLLFDSVTKAATDIATATATASAATSSVANRSVGLALPSWEDSDQDAENWLPQRYSISSTSLLDTTNLARLDAANSFTLINPITTIAESWIGPSSTAGIYFKGGSVAFGHTNPGQPVHIQGNTNAAYSLLVENTANNTAAYAQILCANDTGFAPASGTIRAYSSGYTTSGVNIANSFLISASNAGGLTLSAGNAAGAVNFWTAGTKHVTIDSSGYLTTLAKPIKVNSTGIAVSGFVDGLNMGTWDMFGYAASPGTSVAIGGYRSSQWSGIDFYTSATLWAKLTTDGGFGLKDGITAPATATGYAVLYVDTADGDLKVKFSDGTVKTIVTDT